MKIYHEVWLDAHPWRTREWLEERLKDGFAIHHIDGDHDNNDPKNLLLCEASDHMMLHGMPLVAMARRASSLNRTRPRTDTDDLASLHKKMRKLQRRLKDLPPPRDE